MNGFFDSHDGEFILEFFHNSNKNSNKIEIAFEAFNNFKVENNLLFVREFYFDITK